MTFSLNREEFNGSDHNKKRQRALIASLWNPIISRGVKLFRKLIHSVRFGSREATLADAVQGHSIIELNSFAVFREQKSFSELKLCSDETLRRSCCLLEVNWRSVRKQWEVYRERSPIHSPVQWWHWATVESNGMERSDWSDFLE